MLKKILAHIGAFAASIAVLWGLLILTSLIPNENIHGNMLKSAVSYGKLEPYSFENGEKLNSISDNYADVILLNIVWNTDSTHPVRSSLDTKYYDGDEYGVNWGLYAAVNGEKPNTDYTRYWHGSMIFIRPLLMFTDAKGIKAIEFITAVILTLAVCTLLAQNKQYFAAAAFMLSLIYVQAYNIRYSLEYMPIFIVSAAMCICFICLEKRGNELLTVLAVIGGTAAAFFDFLTCETLSLLMPLLLTVIVREQDKRLGTLRENILLIIKCGVCWGASYIGTFIAKWAIASAVTGENKFAAAISSAEVRISGETEELSFFEQFFLAPLANISTLFGGEERIDTGRLILGLIVTFLIAAGIYIIYRREIPNRTVTAVCIIIGLIPYLRFMLLSNHSYLHEFFTYRAQAVSMLALWTAVWFNSTMSGKPEKTKKNRRRAAGK